MNPEDYRLNPDQLLTAIESKNTSSGRLRVFLGMCAGAGKTYAMLEAAQLVLKAHGDIAVGLVETHGRSDTESILIGLPIIPRQIVTYRNKSFEELDIEAILIQRPSIILIDELAHTNIPGMRHTKRWQDVAEILDNGIDVWTTLNIQHIESRKEDIELITGITIHEQVPDSILERADQVELIDIPPDILLERLKDGKIYLGDKANLALNHFFKEDKLTALREIALRFTSEIVNHNLQTINAFNVSPRQWRTQDKLMVAVSHSPHSKELIRAARRIAFATNAKWIAVNVQVGLTLSESDKHQLAQNIELARQLGAEIITTTNTDIVIALKQAILQNNITQMIIGRPQRNLLQTIFKKETLLDRLVLETNVDVHVLKQYGLVHKKPTNPLLDYFQKMAFSGNYWHVLGIMMGITIFNVFLVRFAGYQSVGFVYLLTVMMISSFSQVGPTALATLLSILIWDFLFIPPFGTLIISHPADLMMCITYGMTAIIIGVLSHRIRESKRLLFDREERIEMLYELVKIIALSTDRNTCIQIITEKLETLLTHKIEIRFINQLESKTLSTLSPSILDEKEDSVIKWVFENNQTAGWSTDTLSLSKTFNIPMKGRSEIVGVLSVIQSDNTSRILTQDVKELLMLTAGQLAIYLEKELYRELALEAKKWEESEHLHQTIFNCISHELKTPMTAILGFISTLEDPSLQKKAVLRSQLLQELKEAVQRLNAEVSNILDMSRLTSGTLTLKKEWNDLGEVILSCVNKLKKSLSSHPIQIEIQETILFVKMDVGLFESALKNILLNAATYTPDNTPINIRIKTDEKTIQIAISDQGAGIPEDQIPYIFDKFFRLPGSLPGGTGLGLAIAKSVIEAHQGKISAQNRIPNGLEVTITLPFDHQPTLPEELIS